MAQFLSNLVGYFSIIWTLPKSKLLNTFQTALFLLAHNLQMCQTTVFILLAALLKYSVSCWQPLKALGCIISISSPMFSSIVTLWIGYSALSFLSLRLPIYNVDVKTIISFYISIHQSPLGFPTIAKKPLHFKMEILSQIHCKEKRSVTSFSLSIRAATTFSSLLQLKHRCFSISTEALLSLWSHEFS